MQIKLNYAMQLNIFIDSLESFPINIGKLLVQSNSIKISFMKLVVDINIFMLKDIIFFVNVLFLSCDKWSLFYSQHLSTSSDILLVKTTVEMSVLETVVLGLWSTTLDWGGSHLIKRRILHTRTNTVLITETCWSGTQYCPPQC